jgi:hypothetical protein
MRSHSRCVSRCRRSAAYEANVKIVEVPPGPPVQSPLVAEVYGLDYDGQIRWRAQVRARHGTDP